MKKFALILIWGLSAIMNIQGETMENAYLNETSFPIIKNNHVIISGCSGVENLPYYLNLQVEAIRSFLNQEGKS